MVLLVYMEANFKLPFQELNGVLTVGDNMIT
jgi:hypothetical protein